MIYDTPLARARVRQPIRVTHSGEEGLMQWSQLRSVFFTCFNEGTHRRTVAVCMRTALFTDVGIYEACNNKVRYYRKSVMRRVYLGE